MEVNQLIHELERARDGANVHTVNKAIFYLREFSKVSDDSARQAINEERLSSHIKNCQRTLNGGLWSVLAYSMRRWF